MYGRVTDRCSGPPSCCAETEGKPRILVQTTLAKTVAAWSRLQRFPIAATADDDDRGVHQAEVTVRQPHEGVRGGW